MIISKLYYYIKEREKMNNSYGKYNGRGKPDKQEFFDCFGRIIKNTAIFFLIIGVIASVVAGFLAEKSIGLVVLLCCLLGVWLVFVLLYGFGVIVDSIDNISKNSDEEIKKNKHIAKTLDTILIAYENDSMKSDDGGKEDCEE